MMCTTQQIKDRISNRVTSSFPQTFPPPNPLSRYHADVSPLSTLVPETVPLGEQAQPGQQGSGEGTGGLSEQGKARYRPVNWGEFRLRRFAGDYADQGTEEVQISHYLLGSP